jgi:hypothetical protein
VVVEPTPLKNMSSSVGIMKFPTEWKVIKFMFQTTNQFNDLSRMVMSIDVRFPEGKRPNINKSTMKSKFPKWEMVISNI